MANGSYSADDYYKIGDSYYRKGIDEELFMDDLDESISRAAAELSNLEELKALLESLTVKS